MHGTILEKYSVLQWRNHFATLVENLCAEKEKYTGINKRIRQELYHNHRIGVTDIDTPISNEIVICDHYYYSNSIFMFLKSIEFF